MSNIIPPLLSDSPPPPPPDIDDQEEDEFGDFTGTNNLSFDGDDSFLPPSPLHLPKEPFDLLDDAPRECYDINSNSKGKDTILTEPPPLDQPKDFHDKRKESTVSNAEIVDKPVNNYLEEGSFGNSNIDVNIVQSADKDFIKNIQDSFSESSIDIHHRKLSSDKLKESEWSCVQNVDEINETNCDKNETSSNLTEITNERSQEIVDNKFSINDDHLEQSVNSNQLDDFTDRISSLETISISNRQDGNLINQVDRAKSKNYEYSEHTNEEHSAPHSLEDNKTVNNDGINFNASGEHSDFGHVDNDFITHDRILAQRQEHSLLENTQNSEKNLDPDYLKLESTILEIKSGSQKLFALNGVNDNFRSFSPQNHENCSKNATENEREIEKVEFKDQEDDEFGDFESNFPSVYSSSNDKGELLDDDDFGDFTAPAQISSYSSSKEEFGNFTTSTVQNSNLSIDTSSMLVGPTNIHKQEQDFEDFAKFPSTSQNQNEDDEFGSFTAPEEDEFGDFTTSSSHHSKILLLNEKQAFDKSTDILKEMFPACEVKTADFSDANLETNDKIFNQIKSITETHALSFQWPKSASQNLLLKSLNIDSRNIMFGPGWNLAMPRFAANLSLTPLEPIKSEILTPTPATGTNQSSSGQSAVTPEVAQFMLTDLEVMGPIDSSSLKERRAANVEKPKDDVPVFSSMEVHPTVLAEPNPPLEPSKFVPEEKIIPTIVQDDVLNDFVSPSANASHGHSVLLRETHISGGKEAGKADDSEIVSYLEPTIVTPELSRKEQKFIEPDEDFDDFQMAVSNVSDKSGHLTVKPLPVREDVVVNNVEAVDDEFGDFTFSLPGPSAPLSLTPVPVLEPLKPSVVHAEPSISWPDPGITDDEIKRFEALSYSRLNSAEDVKPKQVEKSNISGVSENNAVQCNRITPKNQSSLDDDEWSDFVSVQNSSPVHKLKMGERSSTPDLPLSVLNLSSVQPAKQPIPVITPNGLVQTKLSSNMSLNFPNAVPTTRAPVRPQHAYQPSIISNQYANQAYGGFGSYHQQKADDDEWSDFMSHQSLPRHPTHVTPNIIANPSASFDGLVMTTNPVQTKRSSVPSIGLPDLDFLVPRGRTNRK